MADAFADTMNQAMTSVTGGLVTNTPSTFAEAAATLAPVLMATAAPMISNLFNATLLKAAAELPSMPPMPTFEMPTLPPMPTFPPMVMPTLPPAVGQAVDQANGAVNDAMDQAKKAHSDATQAINNAVDQAKQAHSDATQAVSDAVDQAKAAHADATQAANDAMNHATGAHAEASKAANEIAGQVTGTQGVASKVHGEKDQDAKAHFALDPTNTFMVWNAVVSDTFKPFIIPVVGLIAGIVMMQFPAIATTGKLVLYFGSQSFMNIYMGWVMRTSVTVPKGTTLASGKVLEVDLTGCPAGFALTAMQQVISFVVFCIFFGAVYYTPYQYKPKQLNSSFEVFCVIIFGCVFALNIALNNFSLGYISIAVNLIIRSCLPLTTFVSQQALASCGLYPFKPCKVKEIVLMTIGVICAGVFTYARIKGSEASGHGGDSSNQVLGVLICIASLLCGSLNLALAGVLGECKLNVYDTVAYMAIPATVFLAPIAIFLQKPVPGEWPEVFGTSHMSDWEILKATWSLNKTTMAFLFLSGVLSFLYNIIQFSIVHTLSPSATAFGGNFNKAALIFLTLILPFLRVHKLPGSPYIEVIWAAVIINIAAFSYYSYLQIEAKKQKEAEIHKVMLKGQDDDDDDDEDDDEGSSEEPGCC